MQPITKKNYKWTKYKGKKLKKHKVTKIHQYLFLIVRAVWDFYVLSVMDTGATGEPWIHFLKVWSKAISSFTYIISSVCTVRYIPKGVDPLHLFLCTIVHVCLYMDIFMCMCVSVSIWFSVFFLEIIHRLSLSFCFVDPIICDWQEDTLGLKWIGASGCLQIYIRFTITY